MNDDTSPEKGGGPRWRIVAIAAACMLLVAGATAYYRIFAWSSGYFAADRGRTEEGDPWIGAASPALTVHEYVDYDCPHCVEAHQWLRRVLLIHQDDVRLVRHDYARMQCRAGVPGRPAHSCDLVRGGICAGDQGAFWRWNDAVMSDPRPMTGPARDKYPVETARAIGLDVAAFETCLTAPKTVERAQAIYAEAKSRRIADTPSYIVDGKRLDIVQMSELLDDRL
jgi:protein-disulfide isomerase